jgi:DNA-binding transcriptional LysR family regulator
MDLRGENVDLVIRWGDGNWSDMHIEPLFKCPSFPAASPEVAAKIRKSGLTAGLNQVILLKDREGSHAWSHWHEIAGLSYKSLTDTLTVPDPNVRVQAVIDGQGIALFDDLVKPELDAGQLVQISPHQLQNYGYFLAFPSSSQNDSNVAEFASWILEITSWKSGSSQSQ